MVDVSSQNNSVSINVSSGGNSANIKATPDMAQYYSEKSREWAISNRIVDNTDYSSKYYAEKSATSENNAKVYAAEAKESYNGVVAEVENTISQITAVGTQAVEEINSVSNNTKQEVTQLGENLKEEIVQKEQEAIAGITQEAQEQLQNIQSTGFYMRDDKLYFINSEGKEEEFKSGGGAGAVMFDTKIADHILQGEEALGWALQGTYIYKNAVAGERLGYPDFYNKCLEEKNNATETEVTLGDNAITIFKHNNGHQFFNITDKAIVDTFYETFGIADFYGIDEENERIFLPRNKWFAIKGSVDSVPVYGNGMSLGLTDGTNKIGFKGWTTNWGQSVLGATGAYGVNVGASSSGSAAVANASIGVTTDPTKSGIIADTSNVVQPNENRYLYYCVGNTVSSTSWVDVVTQVEGGVKDLVDATNEGIERLKASSNALTTLQISNCTTEIPQRIKYTLESGTLTIKAGSVLIVPYGTEDKTQQHPIGSTFVHENFKVVDTFFGEERFFVWVEVQNDFVASGNVSGSAISNRACFINLTTNKLGLYMKEGSGTAATPTSGQNLVYYKTDSNIVINYNLGSLTTDVCSFPILRASNNSQYLYNELTNVFNGVGYIGASVWLDKNYKALIPNGKNEDGTLKSIYCDNQKLLINNTFNTAVNNVEARLYTNDGGLNFEIGRNSYNEAYHYDTENNYYYRPDGLFKNSVLLAVMSSTTSGITSFEAKDVFRADNQSKSDKAEIVSWGMPDYSAGVTVTSGSVMSSSGWISARVQQSYNSSASEQGISVNGVLVVGIWRSGGNQGTDKRLQIMCPVDKGDVITFGTLVNAVTFFPTKGVK